MISDRDRRILSETERQLRLEDPVFARSFDRATPTGVLRRLRTVLARVTTSLPVIIVLLLLFGAALAMGMTIVMIVLVPLATACIWFWLRRGR